MKLEKFDRTIIRELIRNPRLSDNQIANKTNISVKTVSRRRNALEKRGVLTYLCRVDHSETGIGDFQAMELYAIKLKQGIFRKQFLDIYQSSKMFDSIKKHISFKWLGERDGHLIIFLIIESRLNSDIIEIYNTEIVTKLNYHFGPDAIAGAKSFPLSKALSAFHNYEYLFNIKNSRLSEKEEVFVSD